MHHFNLVIDVVLVVFSSTNSILVKPPSSVARFAEVRRLTALTVEIWMAAFAGSTLWDTTVEVPTFLAKALSI